MPIFAPMSLLTASYIDFTLTSGSLNKIGKVFLWVFDILFFKFSALLGDSATAALAQGRAMLHGNK